MKRDQIVSFEVAKLASEKNFTWMNQETGDPDETLVYALNSETGLYELRTQEYIYIRQTTFLNTSISYYAPTQTTLARFLREEHNIFISVDFDKKLVSPHEIYYYTNWMFIQQLSTGGYDESQSCKSWEEAMEFGLLEALKLI